MILAAIIDTPVYAWVILPILIFLARVTDVSMGTIRVIFVSRGLKYLAPVIGFFEILIWLLAIGEIMKNLSNPICFLAYAGGFAIGNYVGICVAEKLSLGMVLVRVITRVDSKKLIEYLEDADYGVTSVEGQGKTGQVKIIFTIVPRRELSKVVDLIEKFNPQAFYTVEEVGMVKEGILSLKSPPGSLAIAKLFRPFRKAK